MSDSAPLNQTVIRGGMWVAFGFVGQQAISLLRSLVLARLLTPEDFGLVGVVTLMIFAMSMLTDLGVESALIQRAEISDRFVHTAWSLMMFRGVALFVLAQVLAPRIAWAFDRPDAESLLRLGAVSFVLASVAAVPMSLLLRGLRYRDVVWMETGRELVGTGCAIALAVGLGNAWALLIGLLLGQAVWAIWAWTLQAYRPRWAMDAGAVRTYWEFGRHVYITGLLTYVVNRGDDIAVAKLRGLRALGQYQMAFGIAEMLTRGLSGTMGRVAFPAYARLTAETERLVEAFEEVWSVLLLVLLPIVSVLLVFPEAIIGILLGAQWLPAATALSILALGQALRALAAGCGSLILATGRTKYLARIKVLEAICFVGLIVPLTARWGLVGAASCSVLVYGTSFGMYVLGVKRVGSQGPRMLPLGWEPVGVAALLAALAWLLCPKGAPEAVVCLFLWLAGWIMYLRLRHYRLLRRLWDAARGRVGSSVPAPEPRA